MTPPPETHACPRCGNVAGRCGFTLLPIKVPDDDGPDFGDGVKLWLYVCPYCHGVQFEEDAGE